MKEKATLTSFTLSLTVRESKELLMLLYRYDVDLVSLHKFLRKPYLRLRLLLLKKDDNSDKAEEEIEEELKRTSEIRSLAIKESRVCITVTNSPNPSSVYIRLFKHRKKVFYYLNIAFFTQILLLCSLQAIYL